ncbi:hypothetical protein Cgig2_014028 [Carnegiea gigantea]|uniref:Uncharacterized protein n=1 Tax=Carnegiea gigantea TaxID=171969 RepID=A0A9Q1KUQ5_9CARY|nr:hypothetical protein Cgig2_014028 [Carnegiea gigantea]
MGRKGGWLHAMRRAISSQQKEKKDQNSKLKKNLSSEDLNSDVVTSLEEVNVGSVQSTSPPVIEQVKRIEVDVVENDHNKHAYSVALATAKAAEAAAAAAQAAVEVVRLASMPQFMDKSREENAAVKIQTAFRGYMARKAIQALRGAVRLKSLTEGQSVKRQAANTLRCMQTLARVQSQVHARRIKLAEENQALQRQLQLKQENDNEMLRLGETWDDTTKSKEQIEANLQHKQEAAMRRERALAYAYTHQQPRKNSKNSNLMFMDPNNPQWGWSWLERWMAARPWEARSILEKELNDQGLGKSFRALYVAGEINRANTLRDHNLDETKRSLSARRLSRASTSNGRARSSTPGPRKVNSGNSPEGRNDLLERQRSLRRHSVGGLLARDEENLANSSGKKKPSSFDREKNGAPKQRPSLGSAKKRLSFPTSSPGGPRRHSLGEKMESTPARVGDVEIETY